jgi:hypothetical protein
MRIPRWRAALSVAILMAPRTEEGEFYIEIPIKLGNYAHSMSASMNYAARAGGTLSGAFRRDSHSVGMQVSV